MKGSVRIWELEIAQHRHQQPVGRCWLQMLVGPLMTCCCAASDYCWRRIHFCLVWGYAPLSLSPAEPRFDASHKKNDKYPCAFVLHVIDVVWSMNVRCLYSNSKHHAFCHSTNFMIFFILMKSYVNECNVVCCIVQSWRYRNSLIIIIIINKIIIIVIITAVWATSSMLSLLPNLPLNSLSKIRALAF